jgi:putative ABC transport system permease protein
MIKTPITRVTFRQLITDKSTYFFIAFIAGILSLQLFLSAVKVSQSGNIFPKDDKLLLISNAIAPRYPLPLKYINEIKQNNLNIAGVASVTFVAVKYMEDRRNIPVVASDPDDFLQTNTDLVVRKELVDRWKNNPSGLLVGRELADFYQLKIGDSMALSSIMFGIPGYIEELKLKVEAIYDIKDGLYPAYGVIIHERLIRPFGQKSIEQGANSIMVRLKGREDESKISSQIDQIFAKKPVPTSTSLREQYVESFRSQGAGIKGMINLYGIMSIATGIFILFAFCYYNASFLRQEIYYLHLIGFSRIHMFIYICFTQTFVVFLGILLGVLISYIGAHLFSDMIKQSLPQFSLLTKDVITTVVAATLLVFSISMIALLPIIKSISDHPNRREVIA